MQFFQCEPPISQGMERPMPFRLIQSIQLGEIHNDLHQSAETNPAYHVLDTAFGT